MPTFLFKPEPSKAKNLFPLDLDAVGSFARLPFLPLEEEASWDDATLELECLLKGGAGSQPFSLGINQLSHPLLVLGPARHESPSHQLQRIGAVPDNGSNCTGRSNVVVWLKSELLNLI